VYPQDIDTAGNPSQFTHTLGSGRVVIFRNGVHIEGTWSRPNPTSPTSFRSRLGRPLTLAPGGAWVVLVARNAPLSS
jgi:hypothetical protein